MPASDSTETKAVVEATYYQMWWPAFDRPVYVDRHPVWTGQRPKIAYSLRCTGHSPRPGMSAEHALLSR